MNTHGLARHYEALSPRERYPLMVAARTRGDDVEAERLAQLAPTNVCVVANFRGLAEAMAHLALLHVIQLLDSAANLWHLEGLLEAKDVLRSTPEPPGHDQRLLFLMRLGGYLFQVETEAWQQFCAELHLEPDALLRDMPGYATVQQAARSARIWAYTADEAAAAARQRWGAESDIATVPSVLADFRAALAARESCWT